MEKETKGIVDLNLIDRFPSRYPNKSFFNYVANLVALEGFVSVAGILAPDLIEKDDCVFLNENYPMLKGRMTTRFGDDRRTLERYVNLVCISDFYLLAANTASSEKFFLINLARIIVRFWSMYLKSVFPEKRFDLEISENGLFDEDGVCITFSQV